MTDRITVEDYNSETEKGLVKDNLTQEEFWFSREEFASVLLNLGVDSAGEFLEAFDQGVVGLQ